MCNRSFANNTKVLHGGMRQVEIEKEEIEIPREILEEERRVLYGKQFDSSLLENYYESQLPSKTYQKYLRLDNSLPYVSTCFVRFRFIQRNIYKSNFYYIYV